VKFKLWHLFLIIGTFFSLIAIIFLSISIIDLIDQATGKEDAGYGETGMFCVLPNILPFAIIFDVLAVVFWKMDKNLTELAAKLKAYRIISISDLSRYLGVNEANAKRMVRNCLKKGYVVGRMDRMEKFFYTTEYLMKVPRVVCGWICGNCRTQNHQLLLPGEIGRCYFCGFILNNNATDIRTVRGADVVAHDQNIGRGTGLMGSGNERTRLLAKELNR